MTDTNKFIKVENLWKIYGMDNNGLGLSDEKDVEELENRDDVVIGARAVDFSVSEEEIFALMGLSGSGKSTVVRCLIRLLQPTKGDISIDGLEVTALDRTELIEFRRNKVAMVFQHYGLLPHRNVLENVAFGLKLRGESKGKRVKKAEEVLESVGLDGWEDSYPASLSGGMQQRVGIARALANNPPVLLMDEPFSGLDPLIRRGMQTELLRLQEELQKTILFVTHDLDEAMRVGNRMAIMNEGRVVQTGEAEEIFSNPANDYVERFVKDKKQQLESFE
ncbi:MAG: betaine/proline/choline family ABC transporter ATP-binding protein [Candidatus Bipolaricaulia bacterium]